MSASLDFSSIFSGIIGWIVVNRLWLIAIGAPLVFLIIVLKFVNK